MNKRISKSNPPQRKMNVNEEWYIISWELEAEKIILKIILSMALIKKVNPTLKEIKKYGYN